MKKKVLGLEIEKEFEGVKVKMVPVPRLLLMKFMSPYDLSISEDIAALGADLAPLCVVDIEGVETSFQSVKVGKKSRRVVSDETFEQLDFGVLAEIMAWVVTTHFLDEAERGN